MFYIPIVFFIKENNMQSVGEYLMFEHDLIVKYLDLLDHIVFKLDTNIDISNEDIKSIVDFFKKYVDTIHHSKEENILFPRLNDGDVDEYIKAIKEDHQKSREYMKELYNSVYSDNLDIEKFVNKARNYSNIVRQHIERENEIILTIADEKLYSEDYEDIINEFNKFENEHESKSDIDKYFKRLNQLSEKID